VGHFGKKYSFSGMFVNILSLNVAPTIEKYGFASKVYHML